jgi:hypothetical protein
MMLKVHGHAYGHGWFITLKLDTKVISSIQTVKSTCWLLHVWMPWLYLFHGPQIRIQSSARAQVFRHKTGLFKSMSQFSKTTWTDSRFESRTVSQSHAIFFSSSVATNSVIRSLFSWQKSWWTLACLNAVPVLSYFRDSHIHGHIFISGQTTRVERSESENVGIKHRSAY